VESFPLRHPSERALEVASMKMTGDVLLDETLKYIKSERHSVAGWIDLLAGETWNPLKMNYQLRQVRERICKGLVDKGVLRNEKKSFLLFDMPTHPLANSGIKKDLIQALISYLMQPPLASQMDLRMLSLIVAAYAANVLDTILAMHLGYKEREAALSRAESWMNQYAKEDVVGNDILAGVFAIFSRMDSLLI
jgi:golgi phosphoprotein 3